MNEKKFRLSKHGTWLLENDRKLFHWANDNDEIVEYLNNLYEENEQLKQQLREEQLRTTPITLTTKISDEDYKKIANLIRSALSNNQTSN